MVKLLRVVAIVFLLVGLIGTAAITGFQVMQWVRDRVFTLDSIYLALCGAAVATAGMLTLALLEIRDAIIQVSSSSTPTAKPDATRRNIDVRTSYLDIRDR
jgi:hypothetical protein